jgi:hypothetical protein
MFVVDDAEGYAPIRNGNENEAREEAKREAYRDALEKALGAMVSGVTEMENYMVVRDRVFSQTNGIVKKFDVTKEWTDDDGMLHISAICTVGVSALDGVLGPAVIDALGNPRIMLWIDEKIDSKPSDLSSTESEALRVFEKAGYLLVDPSQAKALIKLDPESAYNDPSVIMEAARTLRADVIILGKSYSFTDFNGKINGIMMYRMKSSVQLKAVFTRTAYQVGSKTVDRNTGKEPALSKEAGADRTFKEAASIASKEIVHKIAYALVSGSPGGIPGITVNIKISGISFKDVEAIEEGLRELAGKSGSVYEREYKDNILEIDVVSEKTARSIASFLSDNGVEIEGVTAQTVNGSMNGSQKSTKEEASSQETSPKKGISCETGFFGVAIVALTGLIGIAR